MTLRYMLFGKPGNIEEFADKCRKKEIRDVSIEAVGTTYYGDTICNGVKLVAKASVPDGDLTIGYAVTIYSETEWESPALAAKIDFSSAKVPFPTYDEMLWDAVAIKALGWKKKLKDTGMKVRVTKNLLKRAMKDN